MLVYNPKGLASISLSDITLSSKSLVRNPKWKVKARPGLKPGSPTIAEGATNDHGYILGSDQINTQPEHDNNSLHNIQPKPISPNNLEPFMAYVQLFKSNW